MALTPPVLPKNGFTSPAYGLKNTTVSNVQPQQNNAQPDYKSLYQNYYNTVNNNDYSNVMQQAQDSAARAANQKRMGYQSSLNLLGSNLNTGLAGVNSSLDSNKQDLQDRTFQNYLASRQSVANSGLSGTGLANNADTRVQMANNRSLANIERDANQQKFALQNSYNTQSKGVQDQMNAIDQAGMAQDLFNQMKGQEMQARAQQANGMLNYINAMRQQQQQDFENQFNTKKFDYGVSQDAVNRKDKLDQQSVDNNFKKTDRTGYYQEPEVQKMLDQIRQNKQINETTTDDTARQQAQQQNLQLYKDLYAKYGINGQQAFNTEDNNQNLANLAEAYKGTPTLDAQKQDQQNAINWYNANTTRQNADTSARNVNLDNNVAMYNATTGRMNANTSRMNADTQNMRWNNAANKQQKMSNGDVYSYYNGYWNDKFANAGEIPPLSDLEAEIRSKGSELAKSGHSIKQVEDALYNVYSGGQFQTKADYDKYRVQYKKDNGEDAPPLQPPNADTLKKNLSMANDGNSLMTANEKSRRGLVNSDSINHVLSGTPMDGRANDFIDAGNQYGIDPALLVAMAGQEQGFKPYAGNLFGLTQDLGYGDGSATTANDGNRLARFADPRDSIYAAAKNLRRYADGAYGQPATTVDQIGKLWAADPNWANGVKAYLNRINGQ